jgi:hypothetical protein
MGFYYSLRFHSRTTKKMMLSWSVSLGYGNERVYTGDTVWEIVWKIFCNCIYLFSFTCKKNVIHMSMFWYKRTKNLHCHFCLNCPPVADSFCSLISIFVEWYNFFFARPNFIAKSFSHCHWKLVLFSSLYVHRTINLTLCINDGFLLICLFEHCLTWNSKEEPWFFFCRQTVETKSNSISIDEK